MTMIPNPPLPFPPPNLNEMATAEAASTAPLAIEADMTVTPAMPSFPVHVHDAHSSYAHAHPSIPHPQWHQHQQQQPPVAASALHHEGTTTSVHAAAVTMLSAAHSASSIPPAASMAVYKHTMPLDQSIAAALPRGIPFDPSDYPDLQHFDAVHNDRNGNNNDNQHTHLVRAFREPLFSKDPSPVLSIAYSHRTASTVERVHIKQQKKIVLQELQDLRSKFAEKKQELLNINSRLRASSLKVGAWTRKVFDLELKEPGCAWNEKLASLQEYVATHNKIPEHCHKLKGSGAEKELAAFIANQRSKMKRKHKSCMKYPHRYQALEALGVHWESENDARFDTMFAKLLEFKKEHGTLRMPSLDLCKESGDEELIALHNWVFSQVGAFRYQLKTKKVELVKRFLDIGFSFEKWYGTNGHVFDRDIPPFDAICRRYVMNGGKIDEEDAKILNAAAEKSLKRGGNGKKRKRKNNDDVDVSGVVEAEGLDVVST